MERNSLSIGKTNLIIYSDKVLEADEAERLMDRKEKELFKIIRDCSVKEYRTIIEKNNDYYLMKNLSHFRKNIVKWLPIDDDDEVLEIGAETGAISVGLHELSENITLYEENLTLARILAERFANCKRTITYTGDFESCKEEIASSKVRFNWIILYDKRYLEAANELLKTDGRIVLICDNRLGLKYLAGNKAEDSNDYFTYIQGHNTSQTISFGEIERIKEDNSEKEVSVYYPYPDYRFLKNLYSDNYLPKVGELVDNLNNYADDRMLLFSEKEAFDASCKDGSFKYLSNSYLVIFGKRPETDFVRFSNDRSDEHAIYTTITCKDGVRNVKKYPFSEDSNGHIKDIYKYYKLLTERYEGSQLHINTCNIFGNDNKPYVSLEFIKGKTLEEYMDECIRSNNLEGFYKLFDTYVRYLSFGNSLGITDIDAVFSNIIINDGGWNLIDYEWCRETDIAIKETAYRAIYCYILEDAGRKVINLDRIRERLELSKAASDEIEADEMKFQKMVTGKYKALGELRESFGHKAVNPIPVAEKIAAKDSGLVVQVYPSDAYGNYSEDTSFFYENAFVTEHDAEILIPISSNTPSVRIDPMNNSGIVTVEECRINELDFPIESKKHLLSNGRRINDNSFVFNTNDPNLILNTAGLVREEGSFLFLKIRVEVLSEDICNALCVKPGIRGVFNR